MYLTLEADYAVRIVDCIARSGGRIGAKAISEKANVTLRFSLKILRKLVSSGIIRSYKGMQGGYELARAPEQISICDIIETIEEPYFISRCLGEDYTCPRRTAENGFCAYHELFKDIADEVRSRLVSVSIAKMIEE